MHMCIIRCAGTDGQTTSASQAPLAHQPFSTSIRKSPLTPSQGTVQGGKRGAWPSGSACPVGSITGVSGLPSPGRRAKVQQLLLHFRDLSPQKGLGLHAKSSAPHRCFSIHPPALFGVWMSPWQGRRWHRTVLPQ